MKGEKDLLLGMYLEAYGSFLTEKQKETADLYYAQDMSLSEIAEEMNITRQGVLDTLRRAKRKLYMMEERLQLVHGATQEVSDGI